MKHLINVTVTCHYNSIIIASVIMVFFLKCWKLTISKISFCLILSSSNCFQVCFLLASNFTVDCINLLMWLLFFNYSSGNSNKSMGIYPVLGAGIYNVVHAGICRHTGQGCSVCVYVCYIRTCAHRLLMKLGMKSVGKIALWVFQNILVLRSKNYTDVH